MKGKKTIFDKYKFSWDGGKTIEGEHPKIAFFVRNTCLTQINVYLKKANFNLGEEDKKRLIGMITDVKNERAKLGEDSKCSVEEYQQFLNVFFHEVDQEDRHKTVTMKTSYKFRLMSEFIEFLTEFEPLNDEIKKLQKYCKFKTVDIAKSLKKGEVPKRGGPKEEEEKEEGDELNQEVEAMSIKQNQEPNSIGEQEKSGEYLNNNMINSDQQQPSTYFNPYFPNNQDNSPSNSDQQFGNYSLKKLTSSESPSNQNQNPSKFINTPQGNNGQPTYSNNDQTPQPQGFRNNPHQPPQNKQNDFRPQQNKPNDFQPPQQPPQNKQNEFKQPQNKPNDFQPPQQPPQNKPNDLQPPQQPPQNGTSKPPNTSQPPQVKSQGKIAKKKIDEVPEKDKDTRAKDKKTGIIMDPNDPNKRIITSKVGQVTIQVPVKIKSMDYYKLIDAIKKNTEVGLKECKKGKLSEALDVVESSLEYLRLIN